MSVAAEGASSAAGRQALAFHREGHVTYVLPGEPRTDGLLAFEQDTETWDTERTTVDRDELATLREDRLARRVDESLTPAWAFPEVDHV